jgi:acetyltransferase
MRIETLTPDTLAPRQTELNALLRDAVGHGASIGFTLPLADTEVADYWRKVAAEVAGGHKLLFAAYDEGYRLVGSAQLALETRSNGRHRAEVQKVLVRTDCRRRGIGAALMRRVEAAARARGRTLLFLDTSEGKGGAVEFYGRLGYSHAGGIPDYAADPDGRLKPNVIFYKRLASAPGDP